MKMMMLRSSVFRCGCKSHFPLGEQGDAQGLCRPGHHVGGVAGLHRGPHGCRRDMGRQCTKAQQQLGESAVRLLFFQLLVLSEARPNPRSKHSKLTDSEKSAAKTRAKRAGRPYPNLVDNMYVAKRKKKMQK